MQIYLKWFRNICRAILLMFYQTYHRREQQWIRRFICVAISLHDFIRIFHFSAFFADYFAKARSKRDDRYNAKHSIGDNFEEKEIFPRICDWIWLRRKIMELDDYHWNDK